METCSISFGIVTDGKSADHITSVIASIRNLNIPEYEILLVGNLSFDVDQDIRVIPFDESLKSGWITKKKNLISELATYSLIVYLHDYYIFDSNWYTGVLQFGFDFDVCMHRVETLEGKRYHDWLLWVKNDSVMDRFIENSRAAMIPYSWRDFAEYQYIPGGYFFAKKKFMLENLLNESKVWGEAEDVEWSLRIRQHCKYRMNTESVVRILKQKESKFRAPNPFERLLLRFLKQIDLLSRKYHKVT